VWAFIETPSEKARKIRNFDNNNSRTKLKEGSASFFGIAGGFGAWPKPPNFAASLLLKYCVLKKFTIPLLLAFAFWAASGCVTQKKKEDVGPYQERATTI
jgi:hypothetical protein